MARKQNENLIPNSERSPTEVRENGRKGGIKSGQVRKQKKTMRELAYMVNSLPVLGENKEQLKESGIDAENADNQIAFVMAVYRKAVTGDIKAMQMWIDLSNDLLHEKESLEIQRLKAEIAVLKESKNASDSDDKVEVINDVPSA